MISQSKNTHLTREEIIKSGSVYTGVDLVNLCYQKVSELIDSETVIGDFGSGYGAFIEIFQKCGKRCFGTEYDDLSYDLLIKEYPTLEIYHENSLLNISREKYGLLDSDKLLVVGNPPYNDTTSIFKKGEKGTLICDEDILSRDFGISFLKAYDKLHAKYICVLHPLAYLIKKQNFNSLGSFNKNYQLLSATIFSSKEFESIKKSNSDFPVVCALYERNSEGMTFDFIKKFKFEIYRSNNCFILDKILTIDGIVDKYPTKAHAFYSSNLFGNDYTSCISKDNHILQFYTLRDMNALLRNTGFVEGIIANGVDVSIENLYKYSWLYFLKMNFNPKKNKFIYGNLSPLYSAKMNNNEFRNAVVSYAYNNCQLVKEYCDIEKIKAVYGPLTEQYNALFDELKVISSLFD